MIFPNMQDLIKKWKKWCYAAWRCDKVLAQKALYCLAWLGIPYKDSNYLALAWLTDLQPNLLNTELRRKSIPIH